MTIDEAVHSYRAWKGQLDGGMVDFNQFSSAVAQLRGSDASGAWMIDPQTGGVLRWNGASWAPAAWPAPVPPYGYPQAPATAPEHGAAPPPPPTSGPYQQPQYGYQPQVQTAAQAYAQPDAAPAKSPMPQGVWDVLSVAGNSLMAAAWYWYSSLDGTVKPDYATCAAMVVLPILLIVFREKIDGLLQPIQPLRAKLPPMVLLGTGAAVPLLVANFLNAAGVYNYPFMLSTYLISTIISYVILRQPPRGIGGMSTSRMGGQI